MGGSLPEAASRRRRLDLQLWPALFSRRGRCVLRGGFAGAVLQLRSQKQPPVFLAQAENRVWRRAPTISAFFTVGTRPAAGGRTPPRNYSTIPERQAEFNILPKILAYLENLSSIMPI